MHASLSGEVVWWGVLRSCAKREGGRVGKDKPAIDFGLTRHLISGLVVHGVDHMVAKRDISEEDAC